MRAPMRRWRRLGIEGSRPRFPDVEPSSTAHGASRRDFSQLSLQRLPSEARPTQRAAKTPTPPSKIEATPLRVSLLRGLNSSREVNSSLPTTIVGYLPCRIERSSKGRSSC